MITPVVVATLATSWSFANIVVVIEQALPGAEHERVNHEEVFVDEPSRVRWLMTTIRTDHLLGNSRPDLEHLRDAKNRS
jgi:hypothetical protein